MRDPDFQDLHSMLTPSGRGELIWPQSMRLQHLGILFQPLALVLLDGGRKKGIIVKPVYIHNYGLAPGVVVFQAFWATLGCHLDSSRSAPCT